jgi:hypothetical protein
LKIAAMRRQLLQFPKTVEGRLQQFRQKKTQLLPPPLHSLTTFTFLTFSTALTQHSVLSPQHLFSPFRTRRYNNQTDI